MLLHVRICLSLFQGFGGLCAALGKPTLDSDLPLLKLALVLLADRLSPLLVDLAEGRGQSLEDGLGLGVLWPRALGRDLLERLQAAQRFGPLLGELLR